jgi:hypothetical protein
MKGMGDSIDHPSGATPSRAYWSRRRGLVPTFDPPHASRLIASLLGGFEQRGWFQEWFGKNCVDGRLDGKAGDDQAAFVERRTFRADLWPPHEAWQDWDQDALLTAVEFYCDHVSLPTEGWFHDYAHCGDHFTAFDAVPARVEYRSEVNAILSHLGDGYELLSNGEVVHLAPSGYETLLAATPPPIPGRHYEPRVASAITKFRSRSSSPDDRRDAVRDLADVLELMRPEVLQTLGKKDDAVLFEIANKFAIRHFNAGQQKDYDPVWLSWMFYFYLATIHAVAHFAERAERAAD